MLPCVYVLLTGKSEQIYKEMLYRIKEGALSNQLIIKLIILIIVNFDYRYTYGSESGVCNG